MKNILDECWVFFDIRWNDWLANSIICRRRKFCCNHEDNVPFWLSYTDNTNLLYAWLIIYYDSWHINRKWERTYQPEWKSISLLEWATNHNHDNNHYVKKLANKTQIDTATETDLEFAKHTIKSYFIVGLTNQMKESTRRFNVILGIDDVHDKRHAKCMKDFYTTSSTRLNSNIHPEVSIWCVEVVCLQTQ